MALQLEVDGVQLSNLETEAVRSLIVGPAGSTVRLLLSLTGNVSLKRTQFVRAPPPSPPRAVPKLAVASSPCFPSNAAEPKKHLSADAEEDC
jgi:hypothetical protein